MTRLHLVLRQLLTLCPSRPGRVLSAAVLALLCCVPAAAQEEAASTPAEPLRVGVKESPPFVIRDGRGELAGLSMTLWRQAAERLGLEYEVQEFSLKELLDRVAAGEVDVAVASLTVTPERELAMDFTHPYFTSGLGVAVSTEAEAGILAFLARFVSAEFLSVLAFLALLLLLSGFLVWVFERRANPEEFGGKPLAGVFSAFWWSAVTMTTVGYGDKAPRTVPGRCVALVWMFTGVIIISSITAAITSALTVRQLGASIKNPDDLASARVATLAGSTSEAYLDERGIRHITFPSVEAALDAVLTGRADAAVYDAPILRYSVQNRPDDPLQVLPFVFQRQDYGFALKSGSRLREALNVELLDVIGSDLWRDEQSRLLGTSR
jgi:ABC-type amino acid transport substrate-binding protein